MRINAIAFVGALLPQDPLSPVFREEKTIYEKCLLLSNAMNAGAFR